MTSFNVHIHDLTYGRLFQGRFATARFTLCQEIIVEDTAQITSGNYCYRTIRVTSGKDC